MDMVRTLLYVLPKLLTFDANYFGQDLVNILLFRFADLVLSHKTAVGIQSFHKFVFSDKCLFLNQDYDKQVKILGKR